MTIFTQPIMLDLFVTCYLIFTLGSNVNCIMGYSKMNELLSELPYKAVKYLSCNLSHI